MLTLKNLRQTLKRLLSLSLGRLREVATTILFSFPTQATAMNDAGRVVKEQGAKTELDSKTSTGVGDEVEGKIKKNAGKSAAPVWRLYRGHRSPDGRAGPGKRCQGQTRSRKPGGRCPGES